MLLSYYCDYYMLYCCCYRYMFFCYTFNSLSMLLFVVWMMLCDMLVWIVDTRAISSRLLWLYSNRYITYSLLGDSYCVSNKWTWFSTLDNFHTCSNMLIGTAYTLNCLIKGLGCHVWEVQWPKSCHCGRHNMTNMSLSIQFRLCTFRSYTVRIANISS